MCGRFLIFDEAEDKELRGIIDEINRKYKEEDAAEFRSGEIFPTNTVPVITKENNVRDSSLFKWGFPNFKNQGVIINARSETLEEKPTFRKILFTKRCLIPASGFYEWKKTDNAKIKVKYLIQTERTMFYMAGLYNEFIDKSGNKYTAFVIITTDANAEMAVIHDRMPVILGKTESEKWLGDDVELAVSVLVPYASGLRLSCV